MKISAKARLSKFRSLTSSATAALTRGWKRSTSPMEEIGLKEDLGKVLFVQYYDGFIVVYADPAQVGNVIISDTAENNSEGKVELLPLSPLEVMPVRRMLLKSKVKTSPNLRDLMWLFGKS